MREHAANQAHDRYQPVFDRTVERQTAGTDIQRSPEDRCTAIPAPPAEHKPVDWKYRKTTEI
ncbi:hypothetical protein [Rhodococcus opacus]|uniref:Transposase n=1 Tax=Rhodococcus opacus TaxID=37919 RepID=A0AAX3YM46_RHOOP|nr:hypothetical protein [Rhodococcus opacus]MBA8959592.1 hypothetical protein [Rhodococcus opacus]MCZ4582194.1 hypothetical protein [Rhodococcus opacus]RKM71978.1 hypothetical protein COO55_07870 [Rhodococcus opacus]WLF49366.1 hypothetical protein Q5707_10415 [Rhodococcus opacus]